MLSEPRWAWLPRGRVTEGWDVGSGDSWAPWPLSLLLTGHVPFQGTALSQCPTHKEHLRRRAFERANEPTRGQCPAQSKHAHSKWINCLSSLYKVYATDQAQLCLRNHSDIPVKSWVAMTSLPRWPEDLRLCEEWPFWWTHRLTQQAAPSQTVWPSAGVPTSAGTKGTHAGCFYGSGNSSTHILSPILPVRSCSTCDVAC